MRFEKITNTINFAKGNTMATTRRSFLKKTAAATAAISTVPYIFTNTATASNLYSDDLTVAAIGVGGSRGRFSRGGKVARQAAAFGKMIAVCDVDEMHNAEFNAEKLFQGKLKEYVDYRKLIDNEKPDIVVIGTNDHWHVPIATYACLLYTSPSPRDRQKSRMPSSA